MRGAGYAVALLAVLAVTGCGDDGGELGQIKEPGHPITSVVHGLQRAFAADDLEGVCASMSREAQLQAGQVGHGTPTTCVRDVRKALGMIEKGGGWDDKEPQVAEVISEGERASATVVAQNRWHATLPFAKEGGSWKLDGFFGVAPRDLTRKEFRARSEPFPASAGQVALQDKAGKGCGELSEKGYPEISGRCVLRVSSESAPIRMLTPFGSFKFSDCSVDYRVLVAADGRTWTDEWEVERRKEDFKADRENGCSDLNPCLVPDTYVYQPWKGRLQPDGEGGFVHRMSMCMRTCIGLFTGDFVVRLVRDDEGWRVKPTDMGATGFRIDGDLAVSGDGLGGA